MASVIITIITTQFSLFSHSHGMTMTSCEIRRPVSMIDPSGSACSVKGFLLIEIPVDDSESGCGRGTFANKGRWNNAAKRRESFV